LPVDLTLITIFGLKKCNELIKKYEKAIEKNPNEPKCYFNKDVALNDLSLNMIRQFYFMKTL